MTAEAKRSSQFELALRSTTVLRFDDDEYRTRGMRAELEELAVAAAYARCVIETGDPECEATLEAMEQGWTRS